MMQIKQRIHKSNVLAVLILGVILLFEPINFIVNVFKRMN